MNRFYHAFLKITLSVIIIAFCALITNAQKPQKVTVSYPDSIKTVEYSVTTSTALEKILKERINATGKDSLTIKDTAIITLKCVRSVLTTRHYDLKCNLILRGDTAMATLPQILFKGDPIYTDGGDDALLAVTGNSPQDRVSVLFENLEFLRPTRSTGNYHNFDTGTFLIKIWFASSVTFNNVTSTLENGPISNLDIRASDNVTVNGCRFINNSATTTNNRDGCILQVRGNMNNVHITNNYFQKYGNDELLAFFDNAAPYKEIDNLFNDAENTHVYRRNITVTGNTFVYKKPTSSSNYCPADVMITFGAAGKVYPHWPVPEPQKVFYENVWVAYNDIIVQEHVKRVFSFFQLQNWREAANFQVCHNTITHDYDNSTKNDNWIYDFYLFATDTLAVTPPCIYFADNQVNAKEKLASGGFGHVCFGLNGGTAKAFNNKLYGTSGRTQIKPFQLHLYPSHLEFSYNTCTETILSGQIERVPYCELLMRGNSMKGNSKLYFYRGNKDDQTQTAHVVMEDNFFESGGFELVCQEFSYKGSLRVNSNIWHIDRPGGTLVVPYATYQTSVCNLSEVVFTNNVISGNRYVKDMTLPEAEVTVVSNNDLGSAQ